MPQTEITVGELAAAIGGTVVGDASRKVRACNILKSADENQVSFLHNARYADQLNTTRAAAVIVPIGGSKTPARAEGLPPLAFIEVKNIYFGWQQALVKLHGFKSHPQIGVSPLASIHPTAKIGQNCNIHPFAAIGENVVIGNNVNIYPHVAIMQNSRIGDDCVLFPSVTVYDDVTIGNRCIFHSGAVIGSDGFGFAFENGRHNKVPQILGKVTIQDDVEISASSTVERGNEDTIVGQGTKVGNCVIIGHNCHIGAHNVFVSHVGISGSVNTGKYVVLAGQVGVNGHISIPDGTRVGAQSGIVSTPEKPGMEMVGTPAMEANHGKRVYLQFMQLPELAKRVRDLEKQLAKLSKPE